MNHFSMLSRRSRNCYFALAFLGLVGCAPPDRQPSPSPSAPAMTVDEWLKAGIPSGAIQQLSLVSKPDSTTAIRLAEIHLQLGEPETAAALLTPFAADKNAPSDLVWLLLRAHTQAGDFIEAAKAAQLLVPAYTTFSEEQKQAIVRTFLLAGDDRAVKGLLPDKTESVDWLSLTALSFLVQDRPGDVVRLLGPPADSGALDPFGVFLLGVGKERAGDTTGAIAAYGAAFTQPDAPQETAIRLGLLLTGKQRADEAMATINRLPRDAKNLPDYWEVTRAVEERRNKPVGAQISRGYGLFWGGDPRGAETVWQKLLPTVTGEDKRELYAALHNSAFKREDAPAALQWANQGHAVFPDDLFFMRRRAESLLGLGQIAEARKQAEELLAKTAPDKQEAVYELLCRIGLDGGMPALLEASAKRCQELDPKDTQPLFHLAEAEEKTGATPERRRAALAYYEKALTVDPKNADALAHVGLLQAALSDSQAAERSLLAALSLYPRVLDGSPHAALSQLYQRQGRAGEARFHARLYESLRRDKERWPSLLKGLRQDLSAEGWRDLAQLALLRRENWIARCAIRGGLKAKPRDPLLWRALATLEKRDGRFLAALQAIREARRSGTRAGNGQ